MPERQVLAQLFPHRVFSLMRVRLSGGLSRAVTVGLTTATLLSAIPNALASGNTSKGGEALQDSGRRQPPLTKEEIQSIVPLLSKYFETRQLIADIESSIQQGDLTRAKHLVEQLREANTFEALTSNWLNGPALQSRGGPNQRASAPAEATEIHELRKALEDERERSRSLAREHAELTDKLANIQSSQERGTAASTEASEVKSALTAERERHRERAGAPGARDGGEHGSERGEERPHGGARAPPRAGAGGREPHRERAGAPAAGGGGSRAAAGFGPGARAPPRAGAGGREPAGARDGGEHGGERGEERPHGGARAPPRAGAGGREPAGARDGGEH